MLQEITLDGLRVSAGKSTGTVRFNGNLSSTQPQQTVGSIKVFDPQGEKIIYYRPLWSRFVLAAIVVFLLDLLIRRVRLFDRKFLPRRSLPPPPARG